MYYQQSFFIKRLPLLVVDQAMRKRHARCKAVFPFLLFNLVALQLTPIPSDKNGKSKRTIISQFQRAAILFPSLGETIAPFAPLRSGTELGGVRAPSPTLICHRTPCPALPTYVFVIARGVKSRYFSSACN